MPIFQYSDNQIFVIIIIGGVVTKPNTIRSDMNYCVTRPGLAIHFGEIILQELYIGFC